MTIRERIAELTKDCRTQVDLDALVTRGLFQTLKTEFPNASASELMYEWNSRKMQIRIMV